MNIFTWAGQHKWITTLPLLVAALSVLTWFGVDRKDVTPATVHFVEVEDDKVEMFVQKIVTELGKEIGNKIIVISTNQVEIKENQDTIIGTSAGSAIRTIYTSKCEGRASAEVDDVLERQYRQYEKHREKKHQFEAMQFRDACGILGVEIW